MLKSTNESLGGFLKHLLTKKCPDSDIWKIVMQFTIVPFIFLFFLILFYF